MVPSIYTVSPTESLPSGRIRVLLTGWGYRLPPDPPNEPQSGSWPQTVSVTFGGEEADWSAPISDTQIIAVVPEFHGTPGNLPAAVDIVVKNLDDNGDPIPTEEATLAGGFTYSRQDLTEVSSIQWVCRELILTLQRNLIENVALSSLPDYSDDPPTTLVAVAELPAVVITGPRIRDNTTYRFQASQPRTGTAPAGIGVNAPPLTQDLLFDMLLIARTKVEALNFQNAAALYFKKRPYFSFLSGPGGERLRVRWYVAEDEWVAVDRFRDQTLAFETTLRLEGFEFDDAYGLGATGKPVDDVVAEVTDDTDWLDVETEVLPDE